MPFYKPNFPLTVTLVAALVLSLATEDLLATPPQTKAFTATATSEINRMCADKFNTFDVWMEDVVSYMTDLNYGTTHGRFETYNEETSNIYIPFADPDTDFLIAQFDDGAVVRLGGQDIIVYPYCSPSRSRYSADIVYNAARIHDQHSGTGDVTKYSILEASVGKPVNARAGYIGNTTTPADPYNAFTHIAITADQASFDDVNDAIASSGNSPFLGAPTLVAIPEEHFIFSADDAQVPRDLVSIIRRDTPVFREHPDAYVFPENIYREVNYLNGNREIWVFSKPEVYPIEPIASTRSSNKAPKGGKQRDKFDELVDEVIDHFEASEGMQLVSKVQFTMDGATVDGVETHIFDHGPFCIENEKNCMFDNPDSLYWWDQQSHTLSADDYYLVVGMDHTQLGVTRYDELGLYSVVDTDNSNNFSHLTDRKGSELMQTSGFLQAINGDRKLATVAERSFLYQLTRPQNCIPELNLDGDTCPDTDTLGSQHSFIFTGKLTMNPETGTRPTDGQVIHWQLLHFRVGEGS